VVTGRELKVHPDGHDEDESQEQLDNVFKKLSALGDGETSLASMSKQDLSLMKQILSASEEHRKEAIWRMCDFVDADEALDHVAAYYEAYELGMDIGFNVSFIFALVSANRKTNKSNLISQLLGALQMGKWAPQTQKGRTNGHSSRSPLD